MAFDRPAYMRAFCKRRHKEMKEQVFEVLGHVCKRCGFSDRRALQIDHVHGDGAVKRKYTHPRTMFKQIIEDPNRDLYYQILCANCNWIKAVENKEICYVF